MKFSSIAVFRSGGLHKALMLSSAVMGLSAVSGVQAAQLACGPAGSPLRISTAKATWSADARYVSAPAGSPAAIVDDYQWGGWFDKTAAVHGAGAGTLNGQPYAGDWLSFGDSSFTVGQANAGNTTTGSYGAGTQPYPAVITDGNTANGALVANRVSYTYNEPITIGSNVNLSTIKIQGSGGLDDNALFVVRPATTPSGATNWIQTQNAGAGWGVMQTLSINGGTNGLGFYYGDNTISFAVENFGHAPTTSSGNPTGLTADFTITADCLDTPPPPPTTSLMCPVGNVAGDPVRIGPFTTNARDWKWLWRTNAAGNALENVEQPLFDSYLYRSYFNPATLPAGQETNARWISPGTTDPGAGDIPGVPYPAATGQAKAGYHASVFVMNQPITVGNNVDLASIKLDGRFGFDDYGNTVFVQPGSGAPVFDNSGLYMPNGYGSFQTATTPAIPGFARGQNTIGLMLDGLQSTNDCAGGTCAIAAIADFYVTAACTGVDPVLPSDQTITFPAQTSPRRVADGAFALSPTATASSTLPVTYTSLTPDVCTVSGTTVAPVAVGECQIAADQAGGTVGTTVYNAAARVVRSVTLQNAPVVSSATPVPALGAVGLGLLGLLSAGLGGLALRRRQRS